MLNKVLDLMASVLANEIWVFCFAAVVTLLVNDASTKEQRNTTVAVLGKGSSFGVQKV